PQAATRSRMMSIKVNYPKFKKTAKDGSFKYGASEALRAARSTRSLEDFTMGRMDNNEFVALWDAYINNRDESSSLLTPTRKFDMEVIFALLTFGNKIREAFVKNVDQSPEEANDFMISQPFTMREMRRCIWLLNRMNPVKKGDINDAENGAEITAKNFIRRIYGSYIFDGAESKKLEEEMAQWHTEKPPMATVAPAP
ncbi:MAG: hypothetical protein WCT36_05750, partial [Candidatus Gracilibacteria bacterium]